MCRQFRVLGQKGCYNNMIDPVHTLAISMQNSPGVYAVLLGSGISRPAGILTGWEVTLDLVSRLAAIQGENPEAALGDWYYTKYGTEPDYSDLLEEVGKTPTERQLLLRGYWEPSNEERENGKKKPTVAHHAIAALAAQGYVKVILTTNFDHLMEEALREADVEPTVLSTPDQMENALPLVHTKCCVIKLHGDYLDPRIRNTSTELASYPEEVNKILDQVLDEFGLIVCGWSAEWDQALRDAIYRCQSHRFATYWAVKDDPSSEARRLISYRNAKLVNIESADSFFGAIRTHVEAVREFSRPGSSLTESPVAVLKRYMSESRYRIQYSDYFHDAVREVLEQTCGEDFSVNGVRPDGESFASLVQKYNAAASLLLTLAPVAGYWAEEEHHSVLERAVVRLASTEERSGYTVWLSLKRYPALLLLFGLGIGALEADRIHFLGRLFSASIHEGNEGNVAAVDILPRNCLSGDVVVLAKSLPGMGRKRFPMSEWIFGTIRQVTREIIPSETQYALAFTKLEILLALGFAYREGGRFGYWAPPGTYVYRREETAQVLADIQESLTKFGHDSSYVSSGIFGKTADTCRQGIENLTGFLGKLPPF